jgi:hypothetical protein
MEVSSTVFSHCQLCQQKLEHTALFCPKCGLSTCSWECYVRHLAGHVGCPPGSGPVQDADAAMDAGGRRSEP